LIIEDHSAGGPENPPTGHRLTAADILAACVVEADRHAKALARMDTKVGAALETGQVAIDHKTLQALDLLRQEADGLARMLHLVTSMPSAASVIDAASITRCVPLAAQRARLTT
jgi:hypothetical protein